jgi:hypothetical protein
MCTRFFSSFLIFKRCIISDYGTFRVLAKLTDELQKSGKRVDVRRSVVLFGAVQSAKRAGVRAKSRVVFLNDSFCY